MINILFFIPGFEFGGIETVFINTVKACNDSDIKFTLLMEERKESNQVRYLRELGVEILKIKKFSYKNMIEIFRQLDLIFANKQYDIVHCCNITRSFLFFVVAKKHGVKHRIFHARTSRLDGGLLKRIVFRIMLTADILLSTQLLANSNESGISFFGKRKFIIIKNGIDAYSFKPNDKHRDIRKIETGLKDYFVLGHVGRFTEAKNHVFLIKVFESVAKECKNARLLLIGDGPLMGQIKDIVTQKKLEGKVIFAGARDDLPEWYCIMDLFLFPSTFEGFGNVAVEAQAAGLTVIASNNVPNSVNVTGNVTFLPLDVGVKSWAETVLSYEKAILDFNAYKVVEKSGYGAKKASDKLIKYYKKILSYEG